MTTQPHIQGLRILFSSFETQSIVKSFSVLNEAVVYTYIVSFVGRYESYTFWGRERVGYQWSEWH